jgi:hypothetical protein
MGGAVSKNVSLAISALDVNRTRRFYGVGGIGRQFGDGGIDRFKTQKSLSMRQHDSARRYSFTLGYKVDPTLHFGLTLNHFANDGFAWETDGFETLFIDFGFLKQFTIKDGKKMSHSGAIGVSVSNVTRERHDDSSRLFGIDRPERQDFNAPYIPQHVRIGGQYQLLPKQIKYLGKVNSLMLHLEYSLVSTEEPNTIVNIGSELTIFRFVDLRAGWIQTNFTQLDLFTFNDDLETQVRGFSYGLGVKAPLQKLLKLPASVILDFASSVNTNSITNEYYRRLYAFTAGIMIDM